MKSSIYTKYGPPEVLQITEVPKPIPADNEVLIKIYATTISTVDSIFRQGNQFFARLATGIIKPKNKTLGNDLAGVIEAVGKDVKRFKVGDIVFGDSNENGTHAEYICLPEDTAIISKPAEFTWEEAAAIPYGALTSLPFLRDGAQVTEGQKVLINGASGAVGSFAVQIAKHLGAEVTAVCSAPNAALVQSLGADHVIDYTTTDFTQTGEAFDVIFDTVGKLSYVKCKKSLTENGVFLTTVVGFSILLQMLTSRLTSKRAKILFTGLRPADEKLKDLKLIKELMVAGSVKPVMDRTYPLDQIVEAHRYVDRGHKRGNVVITLSK